MCSWFAAGSNSLVGFAEQQCFAMSDCGKSLQCQGVGQYREASKARTFQTPDNNYCRFLKNHFSRATGTLQDSSRHRRERVWNTVDEVSSGPYVLHGCINCSSEIVPAEHRGLGIGLQRHCHNKKSIVKKEFR